jgi:hypothetical protein
MEQKKKKKKSVTAFITKDAVLIATAPIDEPDPKMLSVTL